MNTTVTPYNLNEEEFTSTLKIFNLMIERKKLSKNNELVYNNENGFIEQISGLIFNKETRRFVINVEVNKNTKTKSATNLISINVLAISGYTTISNKLNRIIKIVASGIVTISLFLFNAMS